MSSPMEPQVASSHRKMRPQVKLPGPAVLAELSRTQVRMLERRLSEPIECVFDSRFRDPQAARELLFPLEELQREAPAPTLPSSDDSGLDLLRGTEGRLSATSEQKLFLRYNYCRFRAMRILREFRGRELTLEAARELLTWEQEILQTRSEIVRCNLPLVLAMAKRTKITGVDYAELISEGNLALLRSVDKFDCSRGYKFSTYACRAILKSFSRVAARTSRYRGYFPTEFDPTLEKSDAASLRHEAVELDCVDELKCLLDDNAAELSDVERTVIRARFALDADASPGDPPKAKTLEQVGEMIGVTKERVRQIQNKALEKLKLALENGILSV